MVLLLLPSHVEVNCDVDFVLGCVEEIVVDHQDLSRRNLRLAQSDAFGSFKAAKLGTDQARPLVGPLHHSRLMLQLLALCELVRPGQVLRLCLLPAHEDALVSHTQVIQVARLSSLPTWLC